MLLRPMTLEDIPYLARHMRREDEAEVWAVSHFTPEEALTNSYQLSLIARTAEVDGNPAACYGLVPYSLVSDQAIVWCLTSYAVEREKLSYVKNTKRVIQEFLQYYPVLVNMVDARYLQSLRWLLACGADVGPCLDYGLDQIPFCPIRFRRRDYRG